MCETPSVAVVIIDAGSLFAEGLDLEIAAILVSEISLSLYNNFYVLLLPYCGRIVKNTRQMENFSGGGGCGGCSVNENSFPWIISNSTLIDNKYFS